MKKYVAICATLAALAWVGVAAAATPQGKLTGSGTLGDFLNITNPVIDGGTSYVGLENDNSGACTNDSGLVQLNGTTEAIVCAHYVAASRDGSGPKMRFAFENPFAPVPGCYDVWRISDGGATDKVGRSGVCGPDALAIAQMWVNRGLVGTGSAATLTPWNLGTTTGFDITASQT